LTAIIVHNENGYLRVYHNHTGRNGQKYYFPNYRISNIYIPWTLLVRICDKIFCRTDLVFCLSGSIIIIGVADRPYE